MNGPCRNSATAWSLAAMVLAAPMPAAEASPCAFHFPSDSGIPQTCRTLTSGESLQSVFGDAWQDVARFNRIDQRHARPGVKLRVPDSLVAIRPFTPLPAEFTEEGAEPRLVLIDLSEQFLGAYENGRLVFSAPVTSGGPATPTPVGDFRITRAHRDHHSSLYRIEGTRRPYPMDWGLRFHVDSAGIGYWIHGRDLPGRPASHGCVGLSDEAMQRRSFGRPAEPQLDDARMLYRWVLGAGADSTHDVVLAPGVQVLIRGSAPRPGVRPAANTSSGRLSSEHGPSVRLAVKGRQSRRLW